MVAAKPSDLRKYEKASESPKHEQEVAVLWMFFNDLQNLQCLFGLFAGGLESWQQPVLMFRYSEAS